MSMENRSLENRRHENRGMDNRSMDNRSMDNRNMESCNREACGREACNRNNRNMNNSGRNSSHRDNNMACNNHRSKEELEDIISKVSFAMDDTRLYLDTHPDCEEALEYFKKMQHIRHEAMREYTENHGPMYSYNIGSADSWEWNEGKMPWHSSMKGRC